MMSFLPALPLPVPTILLGCLAVAVVLVYVPFIVVAYGRLQSGYDSAAPRAMFDKLPPYAKRATWAHQNAFEALSLFTVAALMAYVTGVQSPLAGWAAIVFVVARSLYPVFYILNVPIGRSLMFAIGNLCVGTLIVLSLLHGK